MKVRTSVLRGFALLALSSLTFAACDESTTLPAPPAPTVTVAPSNVSLQVGQTATLSAVVSGAANQNVTWRSGNPAVANVSATGVVTAVAAGTTGIIAISQADTTARAAASVTVTAAPVVPVTLQLVPEQAQVQVGNTVQLVGIVGGPANVSQTVNYTSSAPAVATVTPTGGLVTGVTPGTAVITARAGADANVVRTSTITVTAGPPATPVTISITPTTATTGVGDSVRFVANVQGTTNTAVTWTSTNAAVVRVNADGYAVGVAPGTAVITAASVANPAATVNATVIVTAATPPPPAPSISIASVTTAAGQTINPLNVAGQINATVNVSAVPANEVRSVALELVRPDNSVIEVCRQDFTPALGTTQSVATINCPINTAALDANGVPLFVNANYQLRAVAFNQTGGRAGGGVEVATALFCPQGQQQACVITFNNANRYTVEWDVTPVTSTGPTTNVETGLLWHEGSVVVTVRPALFTGGTLQTLTNVCLNIPVGTAAPGTDSGQTCRPAVAGANNVWTATFPKGTAIGGTTGGVANVSNSNVTASIGATQLLVGGQNVNIFNITGPTPSPLRLDNVAPAFDLTNFGTLIGATDQYVGVDFTFTAVAPLPGAPTSAQIAAWNAASARNVADPMPGVGIAGFAAPSVTFHVVRTQDIAANIYGAGGLAPTAAQLATQNAAIVAQGQQVTRADQLESQLTNNFYTLVVRAEDRLGNFRITRYGTFGVDLVRPSNVFIAAPSVAPEAINPIGFYRVQVSDEFSGVDAATTLQIRVARWYNAAGGADTRNCLTALAPTWSGAGTTGITACGWVSVPLTPIGGQLYQADIPVFTAGDFFYQYQVRTVDRAGNVSATVHEFSYYQDFTAPTGGLLNTLQLSGLGGAASNQIVGTSQATVTGTIRDNLEIQAYDVRLDYGGALTLPFHLPVDVGTYGLPLTESMDVQRSTPLIALRAANNFATLFLPTAASFGVWDMADNFGFSANIMFTSPLAPTIPTAIAAATAPAFSVSLSTGNISLATNTSTLVTAEFTLQDLSIQAPIREVFFFYLNQSGAVARWELIGSSAQPTGVLTGTTDRTFRWERTIQASQLQIAGAPQVVNMLVVFVDTNNNGYWVQPNVTVDP
jgi:uncharacterized protein YjdB